MFTRPRFKPHLRLAVVPDEGVFVLSGAKQVLLRGRLYSLVAPLMDGKTPDEICTELADEVSAAEVFYTLGQLEHKGFLAEAQETLPPADAAWWSLQQVDPQTAARRLSETPISVRGIGLDPEPLCRLLAASGIAIEADAPVEVCVVDHYLRNQLEAINEQALADNRSWLLVKPLGPHLWLGPLFRPGKTGCWQCLAERLRSHRAVESYLHDRQSLTEPLVVEGPGTAPAIQLGWSLAASAIASWVVHGELPDCEGQVRTFEHRTWNVTSHQLIKLPFCAACGSAQRGAETARGNGASSNGHSQNGSAVGVSKSNGREGLSLAGEPPRLPPSRPMTFERCQKTFVRDGGHRTISPEATLERFGHHVSSITGAVSMLQRISPAGDEAMHVYLAGTNLARRHGNLGQLRSDLRNMSAGKGTTDAQAKASGLCEGLERYSGVFRGDQPHFKSRLADLGGAGIDVRECLLFSERQYRERDAINAKKSMYNFVPVPFDPAVEIDWSPVWSLTRHETRYLPTAFCYYDFPDHKSHRYCLACSNGSAAGNTLEEAVLQGFLELVERDSVALWWYNRVRRPGVDVASFNEPYVRDLQCSLAGQGREMHVLDLTSDLEIPVFVSWSRRLGAGPEQIVLGFGAHLDARIAMLRAITEMVQMMSHLHQNPLDGAASVDVNDAETVHWLRTATAENQPYLNPDSLTALRTAVDFQSTWTDDVADDVVECQRRVERLGLEMLVLDQTRPEIGLPVVKVVVPGLRHFWARFAPGRLYDAPVRLGWLRAPLAEENLNPIPMFL
ncbi:MAG TPA: TOMM precursor leader peptide-binding protein [Planctomycetaceae bacterium]|jgi:ribosomal protein S12 methylthiotransferase accessory factor